MDRKHKLKILKNGPNKNLQEDLDCAAWLINNDLADGDVLPDMGRPGGHAKNIVWRGPNKHGEQYMSKLNLLNIIALNPYTIALVTGTIVVAIGIFIFQPWQDATQPKNQPAQLENSK